MSNATYRHTKSCFACYARMTEGKFWEVSAGSVSRHASTGEVVEAELVLEVMP
jgi:hypothetical protein